MPRSRVRASPGAALLPESLIKGAMTPLLSLCDDDSHLRFLMGSTDSSQWFGVVDANKEKADNVDH